MSTFGVSTSCRLNSQGCFTLPSGFALPAVGLGTYSLHGRDCVKAVSTAVDLGYRLIDTATLYGNEAEVGQGVREASVPRSEVLVADKLYPNEYERAGAVIDECLRRLQLDYIDIMLLHHPARNDLKAWRAVEQAVAAGKIRFGALSCYYIFEIDRFLPQTELQPVLMQNELHPYYQDRAATQYLQSLGLLVQSWYPLGGRGFTTRLLQDPTITAIAAAHQRTPAQIILRWNIERGVAVIPGSHDPEHLRENLEVMDFQLTEEDMQAIATLERGEKHDWY